MPHRHRLRSTHRASSAGLAAAALVLTLASPARAEIQRQGFHFQFALGWGGGPTSDGVLHSMELGGNLRGGYALCYQHAFIWSNGLAKPAGGSDLWGGHFLMLKIPLPGRFIYKVAAGIGENVHMKHGFTPKFGGGWTMGLDYDFPIRRTHGVTLSVLVLDAYTRDAGFQIGGGATVGYTWF